ncbi:MAG: Xaa-Pro peptidase family protein [Aquificota bacterium]
MPHDKLKAVKEKISKEGLDGFLFSSQPSVFYLSGFKSTHAYVLLTNQHKVLITDGRYLLKAKNLLQPQGWDILEVKAPLMENLSKILKEFGIKKVGVEGDRLILSFYEKLKKALSKENITPVPYEGFLDEFKMVKTPEEIKRIETAVGITDKAFQNLVDYLKGNKGRIKNLTEHNLRTFLICQYLQMGAEGESFPSIVATGENSAIPHHETSKEPIKENAPLLIDTGCIWEGYCSDFTRTLFIGKPDKELLKIYDIVLQAHLRAVEAVKPGRPIKEVDLAAREYIEKSGYGQYFNHSTGHGVGIEIHEPPRVYKNEETPMKENMVFTIEPGIYLPNKGGVRLENIVVVTKQGAKILQKTPLDLEIL